MRDLPVPDPQPGGAVMRVEATGLCHSDIDHFRGHVHTSWGGEFPSIAGHEIVGRIETITPGGRRGVGCERRRPRRGARHRRSIRTATGSTATTSRSTRARDSTVASPSTSSCLPGSMVYRLREDRSAEELTVFEPLSCAITWVAPISEDDIVLIEGPGHMGMVTIVAARAAGASQDHRHRRRRATGSGSTGR